MTPSSWSRTKASVTAADSFWWEQGKPEMGLGAEAAEASGTWQHRAPCQHTGPFKGWRGEVLFLSRERGLWEHTDRKWHGDADMAGKSLRNRG